MILTTIISLLNKHVPLWVALILAGLLTYVATRPDPEPVTMIEYRDYWRPPIIKRPLAPANLILYTPVPKGELRRDTIEVPVEVERYKLWNPEWVSQRGASTLMVRAYDPVSMSYQDYGYRLLEPKFRANLYLDGYTNPFSLDPHLGLSGSLSYKNLGVYGSVHLNQDLEVLPLVHLRYGIKSWSR